MFKKVTPIFLIAETPLHPGSGSELGIVDLPIQRERHTNFPKIEGSSIKGCVREVFETRNKIVFTGKELQGKELKDEIERVFGPEKGELHAGVLTFTDAKILLFPVKSLKSIFAWITCPMILERFKRDMEIGDMSLSVDINNIDVKEGTAMVPQNSNLSFGGKIVLEEYAFKVNENTAVQEIAKFFADTIFPLDPEYNYWKEKIEKDLVILSDEDFESFVTTSTEVIARTKIDVKTGTVAPGALWYEEYLPQDTILYTLAMATPVRSDEKGIFEAENPEEEAEKVMEFLKAGLPDVFQIGGNQTIGKGFVRARIW